MINYSHSVKYYIIVFLIGCLCGIMIMLLKNDRDHVPQLFNESVTVSENKKHATIKVMGSRIEKIGKDQYKLATQIKVSDLGIITYDRTMKISSECKHLFLTVGINNIFLQYYDILPTFGIIYTYKKFVVSFSLGYSCISNNIEIGSVIGIKIW